ncbi:LiaI-LiaF-like domain-containing protein [Bacillus tuaregi]|uniref:LiaI-LiaF-like domain-containing protein n=1 Tax=Bacillus tuaregi TaxID=1816695 RepID=UPI0008F7F7E7|nr:DUF5668 domain-containing protein [Bacillus tuaregi]
MKNLSIFPGIILIGFGGFFFLQQGNFPLLAEFMSWPTLLMIVGIAFLCQGYGGKDYEAILPGVILTGFGFHFHVVNRLSIWPDALGVFILIISLGFLLRYQKTRNGLFQGVLFLALAGLLLFYNQVMSWFGLLENRIEAYSKFWPAALILVGVYLLLFKRKK